MIPSSIVVPLDGSDFAERAVSVATALATRLGARLVLMTAGWLDDLRTADDYLREVGTTLSGVDMEVVVRDEFHPPTAIRAVVADRPGSAVCMTTHGRGGFRWAMLGSVAEELVGVSAEPVLLVGPRCRPDWSPARGGIMLCHDGSAATATVLGAACEFARAFEQEISITTVIHPLDVEDAERPEYLFTDLEAAVARTGLVPHASLLRSSYPAGAIADAAEVLPASMIVMATLGRTGLERAVVGSVTMGVLNLAPCPVLVRSTRGTPR